MKKNESKSQSPSESLSQSQAKALICAGAALDKNAENIRVLDLSHVSAFTDFFVICSARSDRQVQAIADSVAGVMREKNTPALSTEGYGEGRWVVMDLGDVVLHVFLDEIRDYYDLETLWSDAKPVTIPMELYGKAPAAPKLTRTQPGSQTRQ